jgi:hypothetical protein
MQFTLATVVAFATVAFALPQDLAPFNARPITSAELFDLQVVEPAAAEASIEKRAPYQIILCKDANYGQCVSVTGNSMYQKIKNLT